MGNLPLPRENGRFLKTIGGRRNVVLVRGGIRPHIRCVRRHRGSAYRPQIRRR